MVSVTAKQVEAGGPRMAGKEPVTQPAKPVHPQPADAGATLFDAEDKNG